MESQHKSSVDGVGVNMNVVESSRRSTRYYEIILRILGLVLTLIAAVVLGVNKETKVVSVSLITSLPPLQIPITAKWQYMSAFVYFLVSNVIACSYAAISLVATGCSKTSTAALVVTILDLIISGLLFSANGAAAAVGVIGRNGNSHVRWNKVCDVFDGYCHQVTVALIMSMLGSFFFLWLVALAVINLHKRSSY